ncbi:phosphoribosylformylglycinamidine synthase subunit PurS [Helicobacter brantae]|uniref:Phosphoribosylformylglycinamidine synthase subunit PurS n=1 Tax=Helicobacter brantae TaxID=375927 RepID=A0A3D8J5T9_9HELI|nr:phosphoribosylformylglycinamidine synthase subunit PurS [Helicobacter brantae]RDU72161.1 phosphoribosylformylglycinamidine synthase [Helicobacter brantae]
MRVEVKIMLKNGVLDPQAKAIGSALHSMGFECVKDVKMSKSIFLEIEEGDRERAVLQVEKMCQELLANPVIEDYEIVL